MASHTPTHDEDVEGLRAENQRLRAAAAEAEQRYLGVKECYTIVCNTVQRFVEFSNRVEETEASVADKQKALATDACTTFENLYFFIQQHVDGQQPRFPAERKAGTVADEATRSKGIGIPVASLTALDVIRNPRLPIQCVCKVNKGHFAGNLQWLVRGYSVTLFINAGRGQCPSIGLNIHPPGTRTPPFTTGIWRLDERMADRWIIQDFEYSRVSEAMNDLNIAPRGIIHMREAGRPLDQLMCIKLDISGPARRPGANNLIPDSPIAVKECMTA